VVLRIREQLNFIHALSQQFSRNAQPAVYQFVPRPFCHRKMMPVQPKIFLHVPGAASPGVDVKLGFFNPG
jgi:hypothetical protein